MDQAAETAEREIVRKTSTLIEFPGVVRASVPEWRKEISERVREVQERRAREAAREAEDLQQSQCNSETSVPPQLELLPQAETPAMNPIVAAALRRIERAHQPVSNDDRRSRGAMAAVAYAPALEQDVQPEPIVVLPEQLHSIETIPESNEVAEAVIEEASPVEVSPALEKAHNLVVVTAPPPIKAEVPLTPPTPKRLIVDDPNDPALNYLDSISRNLCVDELDQTKASRFKRFVCAVFDVVICALLAAPIPAAIKLSGYSLQDNRAMLVIAASFVVVLFLYQTLTVALTGRTWAMRLMSLRIIDRRTGLIPTGGQALSRAFLYLISVAAAGLGILFALISRDGKTVHDQLTHTEVVIS